MMIIHNICTEKVLESKLETVELYLFSPTNFLDQYNKFFQILSEEEKQRAEKFVFEKDKIMSVISHGMLRNLLSEKTSLAPSDINFVKGKLGKPLVEQPRCFFNLSHTENMFAISYSQHRPIGVDTERLDRKLEWESIARHYFHHNERALIDGADASKKNETFFAVWTRKEAVLKAIGCGIVDNLEDLDTTNDLFVVADALSGVTDPTFDYPNIYLKSFSYFNHIVSLAYPQPFNVKCHPTS